MGEEQKEEGGKKEQEEKKVEGTEEKKEEEKNEEQKEEEPPEIVLKVDMHCEGCARKVERSLRRFEGVEDVKADSSSRTVVVKGKGADPIKVCERIQKKTRKKVELIAPLPKLPEEKKEDPPQEEQKEEPKAITVILKVRMHCEACSQVLQKQIRKMDGVESVATDIPNDQVIVKGIIDPIKLVEKVYRRTKRKASIVQDEEKEEEEKKEEEKKEEEEEKSEGEKKEEEENGEDDKKIDDKKYEYWPFRFYVEYAYAPQIFSDENPNACTIV